MKGADLLAKELIRQGVSWVSTLCGNGLFSLYQACFKEGVRLIDFRNEQAAAYMADTYARLTGRVGVCAVSSGVAHCNALTGVANAYFDGSPVLLITGTSAGYGEGRGVFQEFDQVALAEPLCKYASAINHTGELLFKVREAFAAATSGRPGPVHLTITQDALDGENDDTGAASHPLGSTHLLGEASREHIQAVMRLLEKAKRPLLVAGTNLFYAGNPGPMIRFCEKTSIPIVIPIWDRGVIDQPYRHYLGVVGAASGQPPILSDADLIFMAGAQVDYRTGFLTPPAVRGDIKIVRIDIDPDRIRQGVEPSIGILGHPALIFSQLLKEAEEHGSFSPEWLKEAQRRWRHFRSTMTGPTLNKDATTGKDLVETIFPLLTEDTIFLIDGGNIGQWAHMLADRYPSTWLTCGASGVVGFGLPGAMGAKIAYPQRRVLLLSGDGAFGFTLGELESASRQGLPFVAVVAVDEAWGIVVTTQKKSLGENGVIASRFTKGRVVRYDRVAEALGADGVRAENLQDLKSAISEGFAAGRPTVIHVPISIGGPADQ